MLFLDTEVRLEVPNQAAGDPFPNTFRVAALDKGTSGDTIRLPVEALNGHLVRSRSFTVSAADPKRKDDAESRSCRTPSQGSGPKHKSCTHAQHRSSPYLIIMVPDALIRLIPDGSAVSPTALRSKGGDHEGQL